MLIAVYPWCETAQFAQCVALLLYKYIFRVRHHYISIDLEA